MTALVMLLWLQAVLQSGGVITGVVQSADGKPLGSAPVFLIPAGANGVMGSREPAGHTDEAGRYRIEVSSGSYHIATGPLDSLIYVPGVSAVSAANTVNVATGATVEAERLTVGVLTGTIIQNGKPAAGATINAIPASMLSAVTPESLVTSTPEGQAGWTNFVRFTKAGESATPAKAAVPMTMLQTFADNEGRFRVEGLTAESYYIVAGWSEAPAFYSGASAISAATAVAMTPVTFRSGMDFSIPEEPSGVTVTGRLNTQWGNAAGGIPVMLRRWSHERFEYGLPSWTDLNAPALVRTNTEGRFEFKNVRPGDYGIGVRLEGNINSLAQLVVQDRVVDDFVLEVPYALVSARVLVEDGTPFWGPELFGELRLTTGEVATPLPIPPGGVFSRLVPPGNYRVSLQTIPPEYRVRLMTSDGRDLSSQSLDLTSRPAIRIDIFVSRK